MPQGKKVYVVKNGEEGLDFDYLVSSELPEPSSDGPGEGPGKTRLAFGFT